MKNASDEHWEKMRKRLLHSGQVTAERVTKVQQAVDQEDEGLNAFLERTSSEAQAKPETRTKPIVKKFL